MAYQFTLFGLVGVPFTISRFVDVSVVVDNLVMVFFFVVAVFFLLLVIKIAQLYIPVT